MDFSENPDMFLVEPRLRGMVPVPQTYSAPPAMPEATESSLRSAGVIDPTQWGQWIEKHGHQVLLSLLALGVPLQRAEELVQSAWERLMSQEQVGALIEIKMPGLILAQARFLALDYLRGEGRRRDQEIPMLESSFPSLALSSDPERRLLSKEREVLATKALGICSPSSQKVFRLYYVAGMKAADVATEVEISTQRVRQILCEVRAHLRLTLEETR